MSRFNAAAARSKRPCPLWVDAFQRDTQHLEADEVGAYLLILMAMWTRESCDLPDDDTRLARVARVSTRLWRSRIGPVLRPFFHVLENRIISVWLSDTARNQERRERDTSGSRVIPAAIRELVWQRDGEVCTYCGSTSGPFHLDHIQPWSRGGQHSPDNLCVACMGCNLAKADRTVEEWLPGEVR